MKRRAGFTLIETLIAASLLAIVIVKLSMAFETMSRANTLQARSVTLSDQANRVLDKIAYAVMGARRETLFPDPESPVFSGSIRYQVSLGVDENGEVIYADPEQILMREDQVSSVVWQERPDTPDERSVTWTNLVRPFLQGEVPNGLDDNGNGIVDESGLSFELDGDSVIIRLSLESRMSDGTTTLHTVETRATCRN